MQTGTDTRSELRRALEDVAGNLWFSWSAPARGLFAQLDPEEWERSGHNPRAVLESLSDEALEQAAAQTELAAALERLRGELDRELTAPAWWDEAHGGEQDVLVAYFCAEFGVDESLPVYSGGLGVLAGDHLKAASE